MRKTTGFTSIRVMAALVGLAIGGPLALAQDAGSPSPTTPEAATTSPAARPTPPECPSEPVSIWYLNNPEATGGPYNNPWANCTPAPR